jgi:ADP-ribose pyrophosphatase YjhB (NUDIX family)
MSGLGVQVAVIQEDKVLLIRRRDFEVWGLPGGEIDAGETPAQAAIREVREETGLDIRLTRLVGLYSMPQWTVMNSTIAVFAASVSGGAVKADPNETIDIGFFAEASLPQRLMWWHRQRIADAFQGIGGSVRFGHKMPLGRKTFNPGRICMRYSSDRVFHAMISFK